MEYYSIVPVFEYRYHPSTLNDLLIVKEDKIEEEISLFEGTCVANAGIV